MTAATSATHRVFRFDQGESIIHQPSGSEGPRPRTGEASLSHPSAGCPTDETPFLSIVVPAYNEALRLGPTLKAIERHLDGRSYEILVVDDGSRDETGVVAAGYPCVQVLRQEPNQGKGAAVRRGMLAARGEWVLFSDADLSTPIEEFETLMQAAERTGAPVAIASRGLWQARIEVSQPLYRVLMGKIYNLMVQVILLPGIWDTQCGFKLFEREAARAIFARTSLDGFGFDAESLYIARRLGYRIVEVPVRWRNDPDTKVSAWRDSLRMFRELWRIRRLHRKLRPPVPPVGDLPTRH
ncbi:MAG TPA: dolichyl-phosphate beta-glucosyltransferase [Stenomitos sp.]